MSTGFTIALACGLTLAALITAWNLRSRARRRRQQSANEAVHQQRLKVLGGLLDRIENNDEQAYDTVKGPGPGNQPGTTWKDYGDGTELADRMTRVIMAYDQRRQYESYSQSMTEQTAILQAPTSTTPQRIRALLTILQSWKNLYYCSGYHNAEYQIRVQTREQIAAEFMGVEAAEQELKQLTRDYILELAELAKTDRDRFWELYFLRSDVLGHIRRNQDEHPGYALHGRLEWPDVSNWQTLVDHYIPAPSLQDLGIEPWGASLENFALELIRTLRYGNRLHAKIIQAHLAANRNLMGFVRGHLTDAIFVFAESGVRPVLDWSLMAGPAAQA